MVDNYRFILLWSANTGFK